MNVDKYATRRIYRIADAVRDTIRGTVFSTKYIAASTGLDVYMVRRILKRLHLVKQVGVDVWTKV